MGDVSMQVLTYAQQSRERANYEQAALADRMQEYRQEVERESQRSMDYDTSSAGDGIQGVGRSSHKMIEAVMQSTKEGQVNNNRLTIQFNQLTCEIWRSKSGGSYIKSI